MALMMVVSGPETCGGRRAGMDGARREAVQGCDDRRRLWFLLRLRAAFIARERDDEAGAHDEHERYADSERGDRQQVEEEDGDAVRAAASAREDAAEPATRLARLLLLVLGGQVAEEDAAAVEAVDSNEQRGDHQDRHRHDGDDAHHVALAQELICVVHGNAGNGDSGDGDAHREHGGQGKRTGRRG